MIFLKSISISLASLLAKITQERDYSSSLSQIESEHNRLTKELMCYSGRKETLGWKLYCLER